MAIYCPIMKEDVLYLDCKDCEDTDECRKLKLCGASEATNKNEPEGLDVKDKGDIEYEKDY